MVRNLYQFLTIKNKLNMSEALPSSVAVATSPSSFSDIVAKISCFNQDTPVLIHVSKASNEILFRHDQAKVMHDNSYQFVRARIRGLLTICLKGGIKNITLSYKEGDEYFDQMVSGPVRVLIEADGCVAVLFHVGRHKLEHKGFIVTETGDAVYPYSVKVHPCLVKGVEFHPE